MNDMFKVGDRVKPIENPVYASPWEIKSIEPQSNRIWITHGMILQTYSASELRHCDYDILRDCTLLED